MIPFFLFWIDNYTFLKSITNIQESIERECIEILGVLRELVNTRVTVFVIIITVLFKATCTEICIIQDISQTQVKANTLAITQTDKFPDRSIKHKSSVQFFLSRNIKNRITVSIYTCTVLIQYTSKATIA